VRKAPKINREGLLMVSRLPWIGKDNGSARFTPVAGDAVFFRLYLVEVVSFHTLFFETLRAITCFQLIGLDGQMTVAATKPGFVRGDEREFFVAAAAQIRILPARSPWCCGLR
jgi:hypothetical protein